MPHVHAKRKAPLALIGCCIAAILLVPHSSAADELPGIVLPQVHTRPWQRIAPTGDWLSRLTRLFEDGVLTDESGRPHGPRKWERTVSVAVRGDAATDFLAVVEAQARDLAELTGLAIDVHLAPRFRARIEMTLTWNARYWPRYVSPRTRGVDRFTCIAMPSGRDGRLRSSSIHINAGTVGTDGARACILEELTQSLGLLGEVDDPASLLHDKVGYERLGEIDAVLLQVLYDPRMSRNLTREQAIRLAPSLIAEKIGLAPVRTAAHGVLPARRPAHPARAHLAWAGPARAGPRGKGRFPKRALVRAPPEERA
ncbi:MAG TPA: DUF2927 domain-containing protein [Arenibaculum sp.]|nr:DUF2927 domain-containing protein [Arenibaculum sp.]